MNTVSLLNFLKQSFLINLQGSYGSWKTWKVKRNLTDVWQISYCRCQSKDKVIYKNKQFKSANGGRFGGHQSLGLLNRVRTGQVKNRQKVLNSFKSDRKKILWKKGKSHWPFAHLPQYTLVAPTPHNFAQEMFLISVEMTAATVIEMNSKGYTKVWGVNKAYNGRCANGELKVMEFEDLKCVRTLMGN